MLPGNTDLDPMEAWRDMLTDYAATSVTEPRDRLVAIAGIATIFKALYAHKLRDAVYHSGIWVSDNIDWNPSTKMETLHRRYQWFIVL